MRHDRAAAFGSTAGKLSESSPKISAGSRSVQSGPVKITDIARAAGVSAPTVSKVLNGRSEVASETRERVQEVLRAHNYQRRPSGKQPRAGLVDLVIRELATRGPSRSSEVESSGVSTVDGSRSVGVHVMSNTRQTRLAGSPAARET
jgi:transcriptional regulator with XRE-family HTH domain